MRTLGAVVLVGILGTFQPPHFRSGTSLLRVDAAVLDERGAPITDLGPDDFRVTLDGRPRKVVLARFAGSTSAPEADANAEQGTFVSNTPSFGRAVILLVDLESIPAGQEKTILDATARLVDSLRPEDAVAVVPMPGSGVDLTRDRTVVSKAVRRLVAMPAPWTPYYHVTYEEALAFERENEDSQLKRAAIERECRASGEPRCPQLLAQEARERLRRERLHVEMVLGNIAKIAAQVRTIPAPVTLAVLSAGLAFEPQTLARFRDVQAAVKEGGASIVSVAVAFSAIDAASRTSEAAFRTDPALQSGVANLATMSGGAVYQAVGTARGVFDRLQAELTQVYELGVEPEAGDLDGQPHEVRIAVERRGTVRARRFVTALPTRDPLTGLTELIKQPMDVADLPIALAIHSTRGDEAATLKVLVRVEIAHGAPQRPSGRYAAAIVSADNQVVTSASDAIPANGAVLITAQLKPGRYTLRFGAIDDAGRAGALQRPFVAGLGNFAGVQASDLIVGATENAELRPSIFAGGGGVVVPAVELTAADPGRFGVTAVRFELRRPGSDAVVLAADGRLDETPYDRQRIARATLPTSDLEPGIYVIAGQVMVQGFPAGRINRTFVLESGRPTVAAPTPHPETPLARFPDASTESLVRKVAAYVGSYGQLLSGVVAVETYTQVINRAGPGSTEYRDGEPRHLVSEFALVKGTGDGRWVGYRDVVEVDGKRIPERQNRLLTILTTSSNPMEQAAQLMADSARFNMGPVSRNFNVPTTPLFFLDESNLWRFAFTRKGSRTIDGTATVEVAFQETGRPTLVTTRAGKDVPCKGSFWVVPDDGTVVRTKVELEGFAESLAAGAGVPTVRPIAPVTIGERPMPSGASPFTSDAGPQAINSRAMLDVTYVRDAALGMWLPARMDEEYAGAIRRFNMTMTQGTAKGVATYAGFKRFDTAATVKPK